MFQVSGLRYKVENLFAAYQDALVEEEELLRLAEDLIRRQKFGSGWQPKLNLKRLRKGTLCSQCNHCVQMHYKYGKWSCPRCGNVDRNAFYEALNDYRLLWGESIANSKFREFFGIASERTAYRLLKGLSLKSTGKFKDRRHHIPAELEEVSYKK